MPRNVPPRRRVYRSALRAGQAEQTRERLLRAAGECFAECGYSGTTLRAIAERADVSVETVQLNGPKPELLLASYEQAFAGDEGQGSLWDRASFAPVRHATDGERVIDAVVEFFATSSARSARLSGAFEAAARSDPKVAQARRGMGERARRDALRGVDLLDRLGEVRSQRPRPEIAEELWFLLRPSHYLDLVEEIGWPPEAYKNWLRRQLWALFRGSSLSEPRNRL